MTTWSIAPLVEKHIDSIAAIEEASFNNPWQRESFVSELSCRTAIAVVVPDPLHGQIIAYACLRLNHEELHLLRIAVERRWRHQGIAAWLLKKCFQEAITKGAKRVYLEVRQTNTYAKHLYLKLGFQIVSIRPRYYNDTGENAIIMQKDLEDAQ